MAYDLTDYEVAQRLRKHPRTVQRWCSSGKLPGAYKAGRSWRIPRADLRAALLEGAVRGEDERRELRAAALICRELREELDALRGRDSAVQSGSMPSPPRNWRVIAHELAALETELDGLVPLARSAAHLFDPSSQAGRS